MMAAGVGGGTHAFPSIMMCGQDKKVSEAARGGEQRTHHERRFLRHCSAVQQNRRPQTNSAKEGDALARWGAKLPSLILNLKYLSTTSAEVFTTKILSASACKQRSVVLCYTTLYISTLLQNTLLYCFTELQSHNGTSANKRRHQQKDMV